LLRVYSLTTRGFTRRDGSSFCYSQDQLFGVRPIPGRNANNARPRLFVPVGNAGTVQ
jgi:hypothetical protein